MNTSDIILSDINNEDIIVYSDNNDNFIQIDKAEQLDIVLYHFIRMGKIKGKLNGKCLIPIFVISSQHLITLEKIRSIHNILYRMNVCFNGEQHKVIVNIEMRDENNSHYNSFEITEDFFQCILCADKYMKIPFEAIGGYYCYNCYKTLDRNQRRTR